MTHGVGPENVSIGASAAFRLSVLRPDPNGTAVVPRSSRGCARGFVIGGDALICSVMQAATGSPEELRRFSAEIDRMEPSRLVVLNRLLQQLKLFELADQIDRGFDADRAAGRCHRKQSLKAVRAVRRRILYMRLCLDTNSLLPLFGNRSPFTDIKNALLTGGLKLFSTAILLGMKK